MPRVATLIFESLQDPCHILHIQVGLGLGLGLGLELGLELGLGLGLAPR